MKLFSCDACGHQVYFESTQCTQCGHSLGYLVHERLMRALVAAPDDTTASVTVDVDGQSHEFRLCSNGAKYGACNWLVADDADSELCQSCAFTEWLPDLANPENLQAWQRLEAAKRRLLFSLRGLGLPLIRKQTAPDTGLTFRFLRRTEDHPVTTGHANGVVTINVAEADSVFRERQKVELGERYRTVLGHLRHEIGHYYFTLLVADESARERSRELFGDETEDYQAALRRHYEQGPPPNWQQSHISAYATVHPHEDWAETFAHYLHAVDVVETAQSHGLALHNPRGNPQDTGADTLAVRTVDLDDFEEVMHGFHVVSLALNDLNRSMGVADAYPFAIPPPAREKLRFVHELIATKRPRPS